MTLPQTTTTNKVTKFRRKYSSTFSCVDWGNAATSVATRRKSDADDSLSTRPGRVSLISSTSFTSSLSLESIDIPRNETKQQELVERCAEMLGDTLAPLNYGISRVFIYSVPTKEAIEAKPPLRNGAKAIDTSTSYLTLKDEYQKRRSDIERRSYIERSHRDMLQLQDMMSRSSSDKTEKGSSSSSFHVDTITVPTKEQSTEQQQQQQQQRRQVGKSKSSNESPLQTWIREKKTLRETENCPHQSLRKSLDDLVGLYAPKRKQPPQLLVGFNSDREEKDDGRLSVKEKMKMSLSSWCPVMITLALVVVGLAMCIVFFVVDIGSMNKRDEPSNIGDQSLLEDFSAHQQDLLELAEQITAECQGSSKLRSSSRFACQTL